MSQIVADRLNDLIKELGLNKNQFSQKLGYSHPTKIYNVLNGKNLPSFEILQDILKNFKQVNIEWILIGEGQMFVDKTIDNTALLEENKQLQTKVDTLKEVIETLKK